MKQKTLTLKQLYKVGTVKLAEEGIEEFSLDAWYLLEYVTGVSKAMYFAEPERAVSEENADRYIDCIRRRAAHIPLQHITGEQEFMGYPFCVNEHVLIPRQDTEILVEEAIQVMRPKMKVLDMCTGSGCIVLSILKMCREKYYMTDLQGIGADVSEEALKVARENGRRLGVPVTWIQSDLFAKIPEEEKYDVIVSNPPYIETAVIDTLQEEVRLHDPYIALDGKEDGLYFYRRIISEAGKYLKTQGKLMFEIGCDQAEAVEELMKNAGYEQITVKKDLAGLDRVVYGTLQ
ncbi:MULTISPECIES: peptide chain release factor N(5)-glutamine methyltransferase [Dorea]|uniref:Release factor glutamine methyltransferase n=1 Tax=Dorea ammoniilytica TaxID=2981788 RepID=A0ABT2S5J9_9FIRM|nr:MULTISPECIES: peptide chain release factor N(5)-glutamine methyltransferase [Dorea]MCU6699875.1 peptide chain release factor N(5)-glutamine methyltransferase [Dorea ammoniilytica]RGY82269.1 peptide chain release factor N(5)-glutamine methyltransferase [Dorea sp. AM58-8]SCH56133.1 Release factor glutamine methyltransferase [uncultured Eubacterium sp.]